MPKLPKIDDYRIKPGTKLRLADIPSDDTGGMDKEECRSKTLALLERLTELQDLFYASSERALLFVLQAMDTAGKDSTIRSVFGPVNPQGCRVTAFKVPSEHELAHDFLWRVHANAPPRGQIGVFNRSHYEDVLVVRVKGLVPEKCWRSRYDHINAFERLLVDEGTIIRKVYLHISKDYQKERLLRRLARPEKNWKFSPGDLKERALWPEYMKAYEEAISRCSTEWAPFYVIPAEKRWFRDYLIVKLLVETLEALDMKHPEPSFDPERLEWPEGD